MVPARVPLHTMKNKALNVTDQALTSTKAMKPFFPNTSSSSSSSPNQQLCPHPNPPGDRDAKPRKFLSPEDMPEFRSTVEGSDLSKIGLVEVLKKRFPGRPAAMIKATLEGVAHRVGKKEADKRWVWI